MTKQRDKPEPVVSVRARRVSTTENTDASVVEEDVGVVVEAPLTIDVEGHRELHSALHTIGQTRTRVRFSVYRGYS